MHEMGKTQIQSLGQEDSLEKELPTHSSILAWEFPWTERSHRTTVHRSHKGSDLTERTYSTKAGAMMYDHMSKAIIL